MGRRRYTIFVYMFFLYVVSIYFLHRTRWVLWCDQYLMDSTETKLEKKNMFEIKLHILQGLIRFWEKKTYYSIYSPLYFFKCFFKSRICDRPTTIGSFPKRIGSPHNHWIISPKGLDHCTTIRSSPRNDWTIAQPMNHRRTRIRSPHGRWIITAQLCRSTTPPSTHCKPVRCNETGCK